MLKRLIIFLIRKKLGLKKFQGFRFANQKSEDDWYVFTNDRIIKVEGGKNTQASHVSLNWILDERCSIVKLNIKYYK